MRILVTGNLGYVGSVLGSYIQSSHPDWNLAGIDAGFFADCLTGEDPSHHYHRQVIRDVRDLTKSDLEGIDAIVHLAAVSNDSAGNEYEVATKAVNIDASRRLADLARQAKVRRFVFASSCSIYGAADQHPRREQPLAIDR